MADKVAVLKKNIEEKIIGLITDADFSITIAMAWFTNIDIIKALQKVSSQKQVVVNVVVDENDINKKYFFCHKHAMEQDGIHILAKESRRFLHDKYMVIDGRMVATGSYNFTKKANTNSENIALIESPVIASHYQRLFYFLTNSNYTDQNIELLFMNPDFGRAIISSYYPFSKKEANEYQKKVLHGYCFTHENGYYDEIKYGPGVIFNATYARFPSIERQEFGLPVNCNTIRHWTKDRNEQLILESFREFPESYHLINDELEKSETALENYYRERLARMHSYEDLKHLVVAGVDIIVENDLWSLHFAPFLKKETVSKFFLQMPLLEEQIFGSF